VQNDREKIRDLWATPAKAWWDNPDDPSIRILKVTPSSAEYWDSPGTVISYIKMAAAAVTSSNPTWVKTPRSKCNRLDVSPECDPEDGSASSAPSFSKYGNAVHAAH
jgi:hypothetical protein